MKQLEDHIIKQSKEDKDPNKNYSKIKEMIQQFKDSIPEVEAIARKLKVRKEADPYL